MARVGPMLKAHAGLWKPSGVLLKYRWLRNGTVIAGAVTSKHAVVRTDRGKEDRGQGDRCQARI